MHREILNTPKGMHTDHINHDGLDNRKCNLRICTNSQNQANCHLRKDNTTGHKGVVRIGQYKRYKAQIKFQGREIYIGSFNNIESAMAAYATKAHELFGEFAYTGQSHE